MARAARALELDGSAPGVGDELEGAGWRLADADAAVAVAGEVSEGERRA